MVQIFQVLFTFQYYCQLVKVNFSQNLGDCSNPPICMGLCWNCLTNFYPAIAPMFYDSQDAKYTVFETGVKKVTRKIYLWNLNHLHNNRTQIAKQLSEIDVKSDGSKIFNKLVLG